MAKVRLAQMSDISILREHLIRHGLESGNDGDLIFNPYDGPWEQPEEKLRADKQVSWVKPLNETGWERCWIIADDKGVYGKIKLVQQIPVKTSLHRATLMMGIERSHRQQGFGVQLMTEALAWAREQSIIEWVDLYVFTHNTPAIALYTKFGFKEVARVPDLFRIKGQKIEDIHMTLKLRSE